MTKMDKNYPAIYNAAIYSTRSHETRLRMNNRINNNKDEILQLYIINYGKFQSCRLIRDHIHFIKVIIAVCTECNKKNFEKFPEVRMV